MINNMENRGQIQGKWDLFIDGAKFDFSEFQISGECCMCKLGKVFTAVNFCPLTNCMV